MKLVGAILVGLLVGLGLTSLLTPAPEIIPTPPVQKATPEEPHALPPEMEIEELRMVIQTLAEENRRLKAELEQQSAFSPLPTPTPAPPPPPTPIAQERAPAPSGPGAASVLYVNPHWHYLVIDQGKEAGFSVDQQITLLREGTPLATATLTEVKPGQSVAEVNLDSLGNSGLYPRENDKVQRP